MITTTRLSTIHVFNTKQNRLSTNFEWTIDVGVVIIDYKGILMSMHTTLLPLWHPIGAISTIRWHFFLHGLKKKTPIGNVIDAQFERLNTWFEGFTDILGRGNTQIDRLCYIVDQQDVIRGRFFIIAMSDYWCGRKFAI